MRVQVLAALGSALLATVAATHAHAQAAPTLPYGIGNAVREGEQTRRQALPGSPSMPVLPRLIEPQLTLKDKETLLVRHFEVEGPTLADAAEVRTALAPYENRKLTIAQIYEAADGITTIYRNHGYLVAKAYVPAQNAHGGVLRLKVVPGQYGDVHVKNDSLVRDSVVQGVIDHARMSSPYIERDALERAMLLTSDLPGAAMPRVVIGAGQRPETTDMTFEVPQGKRVDGYLMADNFGSPFTGRNRLIGNIDINSPLGLGDRITAFGIISDGGDLKNGRVAYSLPLGTDGLRAEVSAFRTTYVLGGTFAGLDATGTADGVSGSLSYSLIRQRDQSLYVWGNVTRKTLNDRVEGSSFADRTINLETAGATYDRVGALWAMPLTTSTTVSVTQGHLKFNDPLQLAEDVGGADSVGDYTRMNLSFVGTLSFTDKLSLTTNIRAQKSFEKTLDSSEQIGLTGWFGIRSFDEGLSGDTGYIITPELKYALPDFGQYTHSVGLFTDVGGVWLVNPSLTITQNAFTQLNDVGVGYYANFEYLPTRNVFLKAMVAHTYGNDGGALLYDRGTKGLVQIGTTF